MAHRVLGSAGISVMLLALASTAAAQDITYDPNLAVCLAYANAFKLDRDVKEQQMRQRDERITILETELLIMKAAESK